MLEEVKFVWRSWVTFVLGILLVFIAFLIYQSIFINPQYMKAYYAEGGCNVATIPIAGIMGIGIANRDSAESAYIPSTNGDLDTIMWKLETAKDDQNIKAVMLQVDSYGGYGSVGDILSKYLSNYPKPVVAYAREAALSNAYWSILPSKYIIANRTSSIGSIGVTMSYVSQAKKNKEEGLDYVQLSSGKFKDAGSPDKELSEDEYQYYLNEIKKFAQVFKDDVVTYRRLSTSSVEELADGRSFMGQEAVGFGLVDEVGDEESVKNWIKNNIFMDGADVIFCKPSY